MKTTHILAVAMLFGLAACGGEQKEASVVEKLPKVKVARAVAQEVEQIVTYTGTVLAAVQNNISPSLGLRIDDILVDVGARVRKGQVLVEMDKRQYLQSAVQLASLETDFARMEALYQEGGVSKQQVDQLKTQLDVSRHATDNLKENTELISPISGVVTDRKFDPGDVYTPATGSILTVMQMDRVKVTINVSEQYFTQVKLGMAVDVLLDVYPDKTFVGRVSLIYPALDAATRTFTVEIEMSNPSLELRPGMFCRVTLNLGKANRVLISDIAVQKQMGTNQRYVFAVEQGKTVRQVVTLGRIVGKNYEILSGIEAGQEIVVAGGSKLLDGEQVEIVK